MESSAMGRYIFSNKQHTITVPLSDDELKWAQEIISLAKPGVIRIVPLDGMNSTPHDPSMNSNEDSSELRQFLEIQNTILKSTQHSALNHININYVNEGKNFSQDSDQVAEAQLNEAAGKSVMSMDHTANNPQGREQSIGGNKNVDNNIEVSSKCSNQSNLANTHNAGKVLVEIPQSNERSKHQTVGKRDSSDHNQIPEDIDGEQKRQENGKNYTPKVNHNTTGKAVIYVHNQHDHNKPANLLNSENQNMHEKGSHNLQVDGNEQTMENINKGNITIDPRIPPPIKVSSNFDTYKSNHPKTNQFSPKMNQNRPTPNSFGNKNTKSQIPEPSPPTVVQSLATRLRANQAKNIIPVIINPPIVASRQGRPSITFYEDDFMINMAERCKYTLVGKFINVMPKMEVIRRSFSAQMHLTGGFKIAHFNLRHIYIDFDNEADHVTMCSPGFKPEEESVVVPIWVTLPELLWHCYYMDSLIIILSPIGKALHLDSASLQKIRGSVAKVRVQIDLTKETPQHIWIAFSEKDPFKAKWQLVEYEEVPPYYLYCKQQGHIAGTCPLKITEEEIKKRKDMENNKKSDEKQNHQEKKNNQQQEQVQQIKIDQAKQQMQDSGMNLNTSDVVNKKSGDQIPVSPTPVIVDVEDHCYENDIPSPVNPTVLVDEDCGGRLVVKEKHSNLQEGEPKGRALSQVMHENQSNDPKTDLQTPATTKSQQEK
ncbi:hypothetical protein H5410_061343 [Solanum commersonii]|uniref:DUF4283 domain-containing protein n=1 Tax=Solanum commersonii TaxID=4109 RepID=A0A9J5W7U2_SOLCO|nr:hypothetical protein H5410_061343 [Solanum commersonii]